MPEQQALEQLQRMVQSMCHEPFYVSGTWCSPPLGVYVGWVARHGSFSERMPLVSETGEVTMIFSGDDDRPRNVGSCSCQRSKGDPNCAAYLVQEYEEDPAFPAGLNGLFQGVVVDRIRRTVKLFLDRYGMQRMYWHKADSGFYFAAEAKAILKVCAETRSLDPVALGEVIACGCTLNNRSLFTGVSLIPAGSAWVFRDATLVSTGTYFSPREWEEQERIDAESYYQELRAVVAATVSRCFTDHGPVALALTGGLDTRVIMAWAGSSGEFPCYTYGGALRESRDVVIGRQVAEMCGQRHEVLAVGAEFLSRFAYYAERTTYLMDGCVSVANSPDLYVSQLARKVAPSKVVGTWGSELLRQAVTFKPSPPEAGLFQGDLSLFVKEAEATYAAVRNSHPVTFAAFRQAPWAQYGVEALEQTQLGVFAPFLNNDFVRTIYRAPAPARADVRSRLIRDGNPRLASIPSDRGVRPNGAARSWGAVEKLYQELTFKAEYAYDIGMPHWLARVDRLLSPVRLDRLFLGRHKFLHFRRWYRDGLSGYLREILLDPQTLARPFLVRKTLEEVVKSHSRGERNHTNTIHTLLTLELLQRQLGAFR